MGKQRRPGWCSSQRCLRDITRNCQLSWLGEAGQEVQGFGGGGKVIAINRRRRAMSFSTFAQEGLTGKAAKVRRKKRERAWLSRHWNEAQVGRLLTPGQDVTGFFSGDRSVMAAASRTDVGAC